MAAVLENRAAWTGNNKSEYAPRHVAWGTRGTLWSRGCLRALEIWQSMWDECYCVGVSDWAVLSGVLAFYLKVSKVACFLLPTDNFRYTCDICGKKYKYYSCFQEHRDLHAVDGEYCFDTQTPKLEWEVIGKDKLWFCRTVRPMMYRVLHSMARSPFSVEAQSPGAAGRSLLHLILFACIKITPSAGTCGPCSPVCTEVRG